MKLNDASFLPLLKDPTPKTAKLVTSSSLVAKNPGENFTSVSDLLGPRLHSRERTVGSPIRGALLTQRLQSRSIMRKVNRNQGTYSERTNIEVPVNKSESTVDASKDDGLKMSERNVLTDESVGKTPTSDRKLIEIEGFLSSYRPFNAQFFEELKALPDNKLVNYVSGYYYGQFPDNTHHGKGNFLYILA